MRLKWHGSAKKRLPKTLTEAANPDLRHEKVAGQTAQSKVVRSKVIKSKTPIWEVFDFMTFDLTTFDWRNYFAEAVEIPVGVSVTVAVSPARTTTDSVTRSVRPSRTTSAVSS